MIVPGDKTLADLAFYARLFQKGQLREMILIILLEIGIAPNGRSLDYLATAIQLYIEHPAQLITKGLYPRVCDNTEGLCTSTQVERSIRLAIKRAWSERQKNSWKKYFLHTTDEKCPTNSEFISYITRVIDIWIKCAEQGAELEEEMV